LQGISRSRHADHTNYTGGSRLSPGDAERMALAAVDGQVASGQAAIINGVSANRWRKADLGEPEPGSTASVSEWT